mgnify:CR=1 FL=1
MLAAVVTNYACTAHGADWRVADRPVHVKDPRAAIVLGCAELDSWRPDHAVTLVRWAVQAPDPHLFQTEPTPEDVQRIMVLVLLGSAPEAVLAAAGEATHVSLPLPLT